MSFAEKLKQVRRDRKITQEELAEALGVSRQAVSKWESAGGYPETEKLIEIAETLHVSLDYLLREEADVSAKKTEEPTSAQGTGGKIAIPTFDGKSVILCQSVKAPEILGHSADGPDHLLLGVDGVSFWGEHTTILGWYRGEQDVQREIAAISEAMSRGAAQYTLQYDKKVELKGIFGQPKIIEE